MCDGVSPSTLLYLTDNNGAFDGAKITGIHNATDTKATDLDATDWGGVQQVDNCIYVNNTHHCHISDLIIRRGIKANILVGGLGFSNHFSKVYSVDSPYGYKVGYESGDAQGNMLFDCCYANFCSTG